MERSISDILKNTDRCVFFHYNKDVVFTIRAQPTGEMFLWYSIFNMSQLNVSKKM